MRHAVMSVLVINILTLTIMCFSPDSTKSKTFARWQGPGRVVEIKSPHGYIVDLNGAKQRVHADRLRKYNFRVDEVTCSSPVVSPDLSVLSTCTSTCAVIRQKDDDFGDIHVVDPPENVTLLPSQRIPAAAVAHLTESQRQELFDVIDRYADCFRETPGFRDDVVNDIKLTADFRPKRLPGDRIAERLKAEMDRQILEMLELGIIRPSQCPMANPLVCVMKGKTCSRLIQD